MGSCRLGDSGEVEWGVKGYKMNDDNSKIVTWNCHGGFFSKEKYAKIEKMDADIYVIQECDNPAKFENISLLQKYQAFWYGEKAKGLGIFFKKEIHVKELQWETYGIQLLCPFSINNILFIAIWAKNNYIEDIYTYLKVHEKDIKAFGNNVIVCGDFNSNKIWDSQHNFRNHTAVTQLLMDIGIESYYHLATGEKQGEEKTPTFYSYYNEAKPYHIDYCFGDKNKFKEIKVGKYSEWVATSYSDHVPIEVVVSKFY